MNSRAVTSEFPVSGYRQAPHVTPSFRLSSAPLLHLYFYPGCVPITGPPVQGGAAATHQFEFMAARPSPNRVAPRRPASPFRVIGWVNRLSDQSSRSVVYRPQAFSRRDYRVTTSAGIHPTYAPDPVLTVGGKIRDRLSGLSPVLPGLSALFTASFDS